jgi:hypothetical protein
MHQTGASGEGSAVTDVQGKYRISGLARTKLSLSVITSGTGALAPTARVVDLTRGSVTSNFLLRPGPRIAVRVRDAETGKPVSGIHVATGEAIAGPDRTDGEGQFSYRASSLSPHLQLEADSNRLPRVGPAPGFTFSPRLNLKSSRDVTLEVLTYRDPYQRRPAVFKGQLLDSAGAAMPNVQIELIRAGTQRTVSDTEGRFEFHTTRMEAYDEKNHNAVLRAASGGRIITKQLSARESWVPILLRFENAGAALVFGVVTTPDGTPQPHVPITYSEGFYQSSAYTANSVRPAGETDAKGRFTISNLTPGACYQFVFGGYTMYHIGSPDFGATKVPDVNYTWGQMRLRSGERRNLGKVVVQRAVGTISGRLVDPMGRPVTKLVAISLEGKHLRANCRPDTKGLFHFNNVVDEPLVLRVFYASPNSARISPGNADQAVECSVRSGQTDLTITVPPGNALP